MSTSYRHHAQVRPFVQARGRTRAPSLHPILVHTIVEAARYNAAAAAAMTDQEWRVYDMARSPMSVAEISAHTDLALGLVRVIIADLAAQNLIDIHPATEHAPDGDDVSTNMLERLLRGLQQL